MSLKKRDRSSEEEGSEQESKRDKRRRQRAAARRQKALAETERKRRKEAAKKPEPDEKPEPEKKAETKTKAGPKTKAKAKPKAGPKEKAEPEKNAEPGKKAPEAKKAAPGPKRLREGASKVGTGARKVGAGAASVGVEMLKLAREMLVIPLQVWLAIAAFVGGVVLAAWRRVVVPALRLTLRASLAFLHFAERHVTPARALTVVALVAVGALVAAQWRDYSAVSVGTDAYAGDVGSVAPAPEVSSAPTHDAHGWVMLVFAALAVAAVVGAVFKRRRLAVWLVPIGLAVLAVGLLVDAPKGLDEGDAAVAYQSANATLLSGFWIQLAAAVVLIACGLMLPRALRPAPAVSDTSQPGPSLIDRLVTRIRAGLDRRRARPKRDRRRLPKRLRRPAAKGKVQGAGT